MPDRVTVRVLVEHDPAGAYHEWLTLGERVKANRLGRGNPRMYSAEWTKWICNNPYCYALAYVHDDAVRELIEGATP